MGPLLVKKKEKKDEVMFGKNCICTPVLRI